MNEKVKPTIGSLFAGIGGFDLGFERAGFRTEWQVEINPVNRAVLGHRFPGARRFEDVRRVGKGELGRVDVVTAGFPCQDLSVMGSVSERKGLSGERSGLFREVIRILGEVQPAWVVLENVVGLLSCRDGEDFQKVLEALAGCGYLGCWRTINAQYFGVPQARRRVFIVGGLGRHPALDFLLDAAPVEAIPPSAGSQRLPRVEDGAVVHTVTAKRASCLISLGCEVLVAEADGWGKMVERGRVSEVDGIPLGLDEVELNQVHAAGNAVVPQVAQWVAEIIKKSMGDIYNATKGWCLRINPLSF